MAARVTVSDVTQLFSYTIDASYNTVIGVLIDQANRLVNDKLLSSSLSTDQLTDIEMWLSAHLFATIYEEGDVLRRTTGKTTVEFGSIDRRSATLGLGNTRYGRMVLALDTSGIMKVIGQTKFRFKAKGAYTEDDIGKGVNLL